MSRRAMTDYERIAGPEDDEADEMGPECRRCGCVDLPVYYTRKRAGKIVRRRICANCGQGMTTVERDIASPPAQKKSSTNGTTWHIPRGMPSGDG